MDLVLRPASDTQGLIAAQPRRRGLRARTDPLARTGCATPRRGRDAVGGHGVRARGASWSMAPEATRPHSGEQHEVLGAVSASIIAPNPRAVCGDIPKGSDLGAQAVRAEALARFLGGRAGVWHSGAPCAAGGGTRQMPGGETSVASTRRPGGRRSQYTAPPRPRARWTLSHHRRGTRGQIGSLTLGDRLRRLEEGHRARSAGRGEHGR
jgi:hypothetical protein